MVRVERLDSRIQVLILDELRACWLIRDKKNILIESGYPKDANDIFSGLDKLSLKPEDIDFLALTHIHIDHAGGAAFLAKENPGLKIFVHEKGAKHLIDPVRIMDSVKKAYQDKSLKIGEMLKIPLEEMVVTVFCAFTTF